MKIEEILEKLVSFNTINDLENKKIKALYFDLLIRLTIYQTYN